MTHTHSHEGCDCHQDHEHDQPHDDGFLDFNRRWVLSVLIILGLLFILRPFLVGQLLVRETSYAGNSDYADAIRICKKMIALDHGYIRAWDSLGYAYMDSAQMDRALEAFAKVLVLDPNDQGAACFELGEIYYRQGKYIQAINYFERIKNAGPKASVDLEADILKYRHGTLGFRSLNSMQTLLKDLADAYQKIGDFTNASIVNQEYEYYKKHQSKVLF